MSPGEACVEAFGVAVGCREARERRCEVVRGMNAGCMIIYTTNIYISLYIQYMCATVST
jgi:hypothetical protein